MVRALIESGHIDGACLTITGRTIAEEYPGIKIAIARWTEGDLNQKLIPDWRNVCELMGIPHGEWNAKESCYDLANASRVYCVHLKTSQKDNRYAAVRGLTVAIFYLDQLEDLTTAEDVYNECALRLSQPGFPQMMIVSPNPVSDSHWIAQRWPVTNRNALHRYIRVAMRDNAHNLDPSTIAAAESLYPVGHPSRCTSGRSIARGTSNRPTFCLIWRSVKPTTTGSIIRAWSGTSGRRGGSCASWVA